MSQSWQERVAAAAQILGMPVDEFTTFLKDTGVDASTAKKEFFDDYRAEFEKKHKYNLQYKITSFNLRKSWDILCGISQSGQLQISKQSSPLDLIEIIANININREQRCQAYEILSSLPIIPSGTSTWGSAAFVVLKPQPGNQIDVDATKDVMNVLLQGSGYLVPKSRIFKLSPTTRYVVFRLDEVFIDSLNPKMLRIRDPLNPKDVLDVAGKRMVSKKYNVLIDLPDDRIQLLLFAIEQELRAPPRDTKEAEDLVALVRSADNVSAAAKALGEDVFARWIAASYLDPSSPMALPNIRIASEQTRICGFDQASLELEKILAAPLNQFDTNLLYQVIIAARADDIRQAIVALGQTPRGTIKAELAKQLLALNPPFEHIVSYILIYSDESFEKLIDQHYSDWLLSAMKMAAAAKMREKRLAPV